MKANPFHSDLTTYNDKYLVVKQLFMWKLSSKTGRYW